MTYESKNRIIDHVRQGLAMSWARPAISRAAARWTAEERRAARAQERQETRAQQAQREARESLRALE